MRLALLALLLGACGGGDTLVVVTVDASPPIANVAALHTTSMAGGMSSMHDFPNPPATLGGGSTTSFGVDVPESITGNYSVHVVAADAKGNVLASGDGSAPLSPGDRVDVMVTLGGGVVADMAMPSDLRMTDLRMPDLAAADLSTPPDLRPQPDLSSNPDLAGSHICVFGTDTFGNGCIYGP